MGIRTGTAGEWRAWFTRGALWWLSFGLVALGVGSFLLLPITQDTVRRVGLVYEVVGVLVVFIEIRKTRGRHSLDSLHVRLRRYMRAVPFLTKIHSATGAIIGGSATFGSASFKAGFAVGSSPTLEERLAQLETRTTAVEAQQSALRQDFKEESQRVSGALKKEAADREAAVVSLQKQIKDAETGGLDLSLFGVSWLLLGVLMTTGTQEICRWVLRCV